jgi:mono/diheme cytochrome c family protein
MSRMLLMFLVSALGASAAGFTADSARGERLFDKLSCIQCHSVNGTGGKSAPDLGRMLDRGFTPATLAATMWNHAPGMWASMRDRQIAAGELDQQAAQDLMAFFYAARFFEKPGDAGRGKRAFQNDGCQGCHGLTPAANPAAKPATQWQALADPIALLEAMWNHRSEMLAETAAKGVAFPQLSEQDLTDMLVYLRNLPGTQHQTGVFRIEAADSGERVFQSAGCTRCHQTAEALAANVQGMTLTGIAAAMWKHAPHMAASGAPAGKLDQGQMRDLVSSFWAAQFFEDAGHPAPGSRVFANKHCGVCHDDALSGAPHLPIQDRDFSGAAMVSALWRHGPRMLDLMKTKGLEWPRFDGAQMADLIAYLNSTKPSHP